MVIDHQQDEASVLRRVQVRELREEERSEFDWRLEQQHYLGSSALVGETMRYVAEVDGQWVAEQEVSALARLAVDGKVLRGSGRHDGQPLQLLSAVTHHLRLTLDQIPIADKSHAIPALKPLLRRLAVPEGALVTADAMHCQQQSARFITQEWSGDYLFGLKGNQSGIEEKAQHLLTQQGFPPSGPVGKGARTD